MKKRLLASLLVLVMILGLLPVTALAANEAPEEQTVYAVGEAIEVTGLSGDVTISGYMDAKDWYVTDGLVLMYDGIYNAGMNQTDNAATTWTELTGKGADYALPLPINAENADNGWKNDGYYHKTGSAGKTLPALLTLANGFTYEFAFDRDDVSAWTENTNYKPLVNIGYKETADQDAQTGYVSIGNMSKGGTVLFYGTNKKVGGQNENYYFSKSVTTGQFSTRTFQLTNNGTAAIKRGYADGQFIKGSAKPSDGFNTGATSISAQIDRVTIPEYTIKTETENAEKIGHTTYAIRIYSKPLSDSDIAQNYTVDKARFQDKTYVAPGSVTVGSNTVALTECTFDENGVGHVGETTVNAGENGTLTLKLNRTGEYTLKFNSTEKQVKIISKAEADAADAVTAKINALPDKVEDLTLENLNAVAEAQTAYNALSDVQKERVGQTLADKLDACVAKIDELAQDTLEITLTYDVNGGTLPDGVTSKNIKYKAAYTLDVPTRKNFRFDGWYLGQAQLTGPDGASLAPWANLQGATITAHWTNNAEVAGASLEINEPADIYALARILAGGSDSADFECFGLTVSDDNRTLLQNASYALKTDIALDDQNNTFYGIPNFKGTFDGQNKTIDVKFDLQGTWSKDTKFGCLFATLDGGTVKNVNFTGTLTGTVNVTAGLQDVAVVAGYTDNGATIQNVTTNVSMNLNFATSATGPCVYIGAFVGRAHGGADKLVDCVNTADLIAKFTGFSANGGCRLAGLMGHAYAGVTFTNCKNSGDIDSSKSYTQTLTGGMIGSGASNIFTNCELSGSVDGGDYVVAPYKSMGDGSTGNVMVVTVTGAAGQTIAYTGDASQTVTLTSSNTTATFRIPVERKGDTTENDAFSYEESLTVDGVRLDWFKLDNTRLTLALNTSEAAALHVPFQTESSALVLKTEEDLLNLQKALNEGDHAALAAIYTTIGGQTITNDNTARIALETAYYKLGNDITVTSTAFTGIGTNGTPFSGHFDGQGHTVTLQRSTNAAISSDDYGLFGYVRTGANGAPAIHDLTVRIDAEVNTSGHNAYVGALAGQISGCDLTNIQIEVTKLNVTGGENYSLQVGGLAGSAFNNQASNVSVAVNGPLTAAGSAPSIYLGGAFGSGVLRGPVTVTYNTGAQLSAENTRSSGAVCIGGLVGYNASGDMDLRGSKLVNATGSTFPISAEALGAIHAGGWIGELTDATASQERWLYVDGTTVMDGAFSVNANSSSNMVYAGGVAGSTNVSFSVSIEDYLNTAAVTSGNIAGGLIGRASNRGDNNSITIKNSANGGALAGKTVGGLIGQLDVSNSAVTFEDALYVKTVSVTKAVGNQKGTDAAGTIALNADEVTNGAFGDTITDVLSENAPAALTVSDNAKLDGTGLTYTKAGNGQTVTFFWNGQELYSKTVNVARKDMTNEQIEVIGVSSSYADDTAAAADAANLRVLYNGQLLENGKDFTVTAENSSFNITFSGNYSGEQQRSYSIDSTFTATAAGFECVYDGNAHGIKVIASDGAVVTYSNAANGDFAAEEITQTDVGVKIVYWKAVSSDGSKTITGSAVITITKANQSLSYADTALRRELGAPDFINPLNRSTVFGTITYTSSNPTVATVDETGKVTIRGIGTTTITATAAGSENYNTASASYLLTVTSATPVTPSEPAKNPFNPDAGKTKFVDVSDNAWYASAINYVVDKGLMNGTGDNKFSPNADTTRGMIVTILARLSGQSTAGTPWYAAGQRWAMEHEISDGTNMTSAITREQLVTMLFRYAVKNGLEAVTLAENLSRFTDASSVSAWAVPAMQWAVGQGLIQGSNGLLRPQANASRAEVATILMRFCELPNK